MDLSNLLSNLPATRPVDQESVDGINTELAIEFKNAANSITSLYNTKLKDATTPPTTSSTSQNTEFAKAAKSVASLYRLSKTSNSLNHYNGYLSCLNDVLTVLSDHGDIENWALMKKAEIANIHKCRQSDDDEPEPEVAASVTAVSPPEIPKDHVFSMSPDLVAPYQFRPSYAPLSVIHSPRQRSNWKQLKKEKEVNRKRAEEVKEEDAEARKRKSHDKGEQRRKRDKKT
ncbi:hypothetical protein PSN45_003684 [Yamadazyma tenuis]|uniref:Uncharacterized protein n=1 Tax=Candida tenuis (strain ATCC 10573 / BCRC 21748 / CBS 615 / JCM 9827 / NBRC 10315 / NRRL Y-1498 / VKM Y-70) TaxID=590646 RepID=G3B3M9_CANTC|nr:uncharacterized protein CANTEDRAFT_93713 [Yamadazyma tenuis ATCC 10573]EGV64190.1 hypothetical protein CANTEDRAFT_93713 [Yamadazyma tenuis ATCC 10573]WEJ96148.1 hypothetical protein PSN45_003684 [Yamadazyma tenuis]